MLYRESLVSRITGSAITKLQVIFCLLTLPSRTCCQASKLKDSDAINTVQPSQTVANVLLAGPVDGVGPEDRAGASISRTQSMSPLAIPFSKTSAVTNVLSQQAVRAVSYSGTQRVVAGASTPRRACQVTMTCHVLPAVTMVTTLSAPHLRRRHRQRPHPEAFHRR